ncbi:MAG: glycosyltransferase family 4 protein [Balneolaceae bacterium]|nr:glycosyltransferase family 4 protein [Balneolaceae bacterium]
MSPKKVLLITYYWPPAGGSGVQRWVKFCKYLREFGWEPIVYTPSNPEPPAIDKTLVKDIPDDITILKRPIWEPYSLYKKLLGMKKDAKLGAGLMKQEKGSSLLQKLSIWMRGNLFIPDARKFWIRPSVKYLTAYLEQHQVDAIATTGPPHSMHMIGLGVKENTGIPWLADFRDPWTNIDFFEDLSLSKWARNIHHRLEKKVLEQADSVTVIGPTMKKEFEEIVDKKISIITNGYDEDDFRDIAVAPSEDHFLLSHIGMMTPTRNPETLWQALTELNAESDEFRNKFRLQLIGKIDITIREKILHYSLEQNVDIIDYVPHDKIIRMQKESDALLLVINESPNANLLLPGKLFEYLAARKPIICLSPVEGDVCYVLDKTKAGILINTYDKEALKTHLRQLFNQWKEGNISSNNESIDEFSRKNLTQQLASQLDHLIS